MFEVFAIMAYYNKICRFMMKIIENKPLIINYSIP